MQVAILGPLEVRGADGSPIAISGARLRSLLCRLALDAGKPVPVNVLVDAVWADQPPADSANALQTLVSRLRRVLGEPSLVVQSAAGYRLAVEPDAVDAHRFERCAASGSAALAAGEPSRAAAELAEALALWRGQALVDLIEDFDHPAATRLHERRLSALLDRIEADLGLGRSGSVLPELEVLVAQYPLNERLTGHLMTALSQAGQQADALRAFERLRTALADELGVDPSAELREIQLRALRGELGRAPAERRTNLRAQLTSFIGRDAEVARIAQSLQGNRLVTLVGPGGAGKTRLASEAASSILELSPDGSWLVELAPVTDAADLPQTVLGSLGIREAHLLDRRGRRNTRDALSRLLENLADKDALLILDNCEHLVDASARLADQLLGQCPRLRVLATSREPLGITGEVLLVVPPLGQPEPTAAAEQALGYPAVALFADRAGAVQPDFEMDATSTPLVIDIVRRLDGLPLAIELAAARLRTLPLADIAHRLSDRFRLLTGGSRTAMPRHRTLRAVVEWSWELLAPAERVLAERLAVFPAGVTSASAGAVCADELVSAEEIEELLAALVDKSLLQPVSGGSRLRMLETIREYGIERLAERGELRQVRARHAGYFDGLVQEAEPHLISAGQLPWFALLTAERDNIMAAMRFRCDAGDADGALRIAVSISGFAMLLGNHAEVPLWLSEALAVPGEPDSELRWVAEALYAMNIASAPITTDTASVSFDRLRESGAKLDQVDLEEHPLLGLLRAAVAFFAEDQERADRYVTEALASGNDWVVASILMFRANMAENRGDVEATRADVTAALAEFRRLGERWGMASSLRGLAQLLTLDGDLDGAMAAYEEALRLMAEMNSRDDEAFLRTRMADLCLRRGDQAGARAQIRLAQAINDSTGSTLESVFILCMLAEVERRGGNTAVARVLYAQAMQRLDAIPPAHPLRGHGTAIVLAISTRLAVTDGELDRARDYAGRAYTAALGTKDQPIIASVGVVLALLASALGDPARAARLLGASASLRGAEDRTDADIRQLFDELESALGTEQFAIEYDHGRGLEHPAAIALLDPS